MEVILKEDVPQLGHRGDVVKVAEGYGRNYLLPRKLAIEATQANKSVIEQMKQAAVRRSAVQGRPCHLNRCCNRLQPFLQPFGQPKGRVVAEILHFSGVFRTILALSRLRQGFESPWG